MTPFFERSKLKVLSFNGYGQKVNHWITEIYSISWNEGKDDVETKEPEAEDLGRKKKSSFGDDENLSKILHRRSSRRTKFGWKIFKSYRDCNLIVIFIMNSDECQIDEYICEREPCYCHLRIQTFVAALNNHLLNTFL